MAFTEPEVLHALLDKLAESIIIYTRYQADAGAQAVQLFDSWASFLTPDDFEVFSLPYLKKIIEEVKKTHPDLPIILYASGSGGLLERMALAKPDIMSIDASVDLLDAKKRLPETLGLQGNMDPAALFGSKEHIEKEVIKMAKKGAGRAHIMNLGHADGGFLEFPGACFWCNPQFTYRTYVWCSDGDFVHHPFLETSEGHTFVIVARIHAVHEGIPVATDESKEDTSVRIRQPRTTCATRHQSNGVGGFSISHGHAFS
eukprot:jgi/Pico_ML_1/55164/g897.t2